MMHSDTDYPLLRSSLAPEYFELSDEQLDALVAQMYGEGVDAEAVESFWRDVGRGFNRVGRSVGRLAQQAAPMMGGVLSGAAQGAVTGSGFGGPFGAIAGALAGVKLPAEVFNKLLVAAMVAMLATLVINPKRFLKKDHEIEMTPLRIGVTIVVFLAIGFYSGIVQAGVGFYLIAAIVLTTGSNLVKTNMLKVFIIGATTLAALIIFAASGQVDWLYGLLLAVGNGSGAWIGSHAAVKGGEKLVKIVLAVMLVVLIVRYLGIFPWFSA